MLPVYWAEKTNQNDELAFNASLVTDWLVNFLRFEISRRRGMKGAVLGLSGGVDSAVVAHLCARAFGPENVHAIMMPYKISSPSSLADAEKVLASTGINGRKIDITPAVDGYVSLNEEDLSSTRLGNICARVRMTILFDQSAKLGVLPVGTGNKSERLFGYYTWHADDSPPINPLGDLFKTQVWKLAEHLGVHPDVVHKPASADLVEGQTDEKDYGITYAAADPILKYITQGYTFQQLLNLGFPADQVKLVWNKVAGTHWKRRLPTVAMMTNGAIGEYYLRPVDY